MQYNRTRDSRCAYIQSYRHPSVFVTGYEINSVANKLMHRMEIAVRITEITVIFSDLKNVSLVNHSKFHDYL